MRNKAKILIIAVVLLTGLIGYWIYQDDLNSHGRLYPTKEKMCQEFALSYLRTVQKTDAVMGGKLWEAAVAVESDLYNLCLLDLKNESLEQYKTNNLQKYLQKGGENE